MGSPGLARQGCSLEALQGWWARKGTLQSCRAVSWWDAEAERGAANPAEQRLGGMLGLGRPTSPAGQIPGGMLRMGRQGGTPSSPAGQPPGEA